MKRLLIALSVLLAACSSGLTQDDVDEAVARALQESETESAEPEPEPQADERGDDEQIYINVVKRELSFPASDEQILEMGDRACETLDNLEPSSMDEVIDVIAMTSSDQQERLDLVTIFTAAAGSGYCPGHGHL